MTWGFRGAFVGVSNWRNEIPTGIEKPPDEKALRLDEKALRQLDIFRHLFRHSKKAICKDN